jgi:hypothetical protein
MLTGWKDAFDTIPGILLALLPYGYAADRVGRKPILLLSLTGLILEEMSVRIVCWSHPAIPETMHSLGDHDIETRRDRGLPSTEAAPQRKWTHEQWWGQRWKSIQRSGLTSTNVLCILGSFLMASAGR